MAKGKDKGGGTLQSQIKNLKDKLTDEEVKQAATLRDEFNPDVIRLANRMNSLGTAALTKSQLKYYQDFAATDAKAAEKWKERKLAEKTK